MSKGCQALYALELVKLVLPAAVQFQPHLDAAKYHLLASFKVDAQLHDISIVNWERFGLLARRAKADVVEKSTAAALHILDVPFAFLVPELAVSPADDLGFESDRCRRRDVGRYLGLAISLGITTDSNNFVTGRKCASYRGEVQRRALASRIDKDGESDGG